MHANVILEREQYIAVRRGGDINAVSNRPEHNTHTKHYGHKPATHKDHNNTKPIWKIIVLCNALCFKLKPKKTAKNKPSPIVIPKKTRKNILKYYLQSTLEIAFRTYTTLHAGSTWQAERTPKNNHYTTPTNPLLRRVIRDSTDRSHDSRPIQRTRAHESRVLRHSDSKRKWKEIPKVQVSANIVKRVSTFKN